MNDEETRAEEYRAAQRRRRAARVALARTLAGNAEARRQIEDDWRPLYLALLELKEGGDWDVEQ